MVTCPVFTATTPTLSTLSANLCSSGILSNQPRHHKPPGTRCKTFLQMIGCRKTVPPRTLRIASFGDLCIVLELEFRNPVVIRYTGCAFEADPVFLGDPSRIDCDLIAGVVAHFHTEVVVQQLDIELSQAHRLAIS